jgi:hypothetical protein
VVEDRDEAHVQAISEGIRKAIDGPNSENDVDHVVSAIMGDEEVEDDEPDSRPEQG